MTKRHVHLVCSLRSQRKGYTWECFALVCQYTIFFSKNLQLDHSQGAYYMTLSKCKKQLAIAWLNGWTEFMQDLLKKQLQMLWQLWFGCKLCTLSFGWLHSHSSSFSLFSSILAIKILGSYPIDGHIFAGTAARRDFIMPVSRVTTAKLQAKTCRQFAVSISKTEKETEKETERRREKEREGKLWCFLCDFFDNISFREFFMLLVELKIPQIIQHIQRYYDISTN